MITLDAMTNLVVKDDVDTEKIIADLNKRFSEPLPKFYKRRIIFWHDEEKGFADKISEIELANAKIVVLTGRNYFAVKKLLCADDTDSNYLIYSPIPREVPENNWLIDIELYSEEFSADLISMWLNEMNLSPTPELRGAIKKYKKFMNAKERRKRIMLQRHTPTTASEMQLSIMAALAGLNDAKPANIIKAMLCGGLSAEENNLLRDFKNYGIDEVFWQMVAQGIGYQEEEKDIGNLAAHILLTAATRTIRQDFFARLEKFISIDHQAYCYDIVSDWLSADDKNDLKKIAKFVEEKTKLHERFMKFDVADLVNNQVFPCVNEIILVKLMNDIKNNIVDSTKIRQTIEKRRTFAWYEDFKNFFEGICQFTNMQEFYKKHSDGFHAIDTKKIWKEYITDYYKMDSYYRLFHKSYDARSKADNSNLLDMFSDVKDKVEDIYVNWFLEELGENWSNAACDNLREQGYIADVSLQTDFYHHKVAQSDSKVYVIISDAMRYEVAAELAEKLRGETQSKVNIDAMQGIFPTITKFGMAALLPHKKLTVKLKAGKLSVLADDKSTESSDRDKLLKSANSKSIAIKYKDIIEMKRAERKDLVRGMEVVYIYHDTIDAAGHEENSVFSACTKAIEDIKTIVRIITGEFGGTHILITSDHGFLYTVSPLREDDKVKKSTSTDQDVEIASRYAIMKKSATPEYLLPVKFLGGETEYNAFAPRGSMRIKKQGGGSKNFVHGGISLQEMIIPVIDYHFLRKDSNEYIKNKAKYEVQPVTIDLLSSAHKISNMNFSLTFYQKEAVKANFHAATYKLYFVDSAGMRVSDASKIIADKIDENNEARKFRVNFNLKQLKYNNTEDYHLVIADENDNKISSYKFQIDIAVEFNAFSFFN